MRLRKLGCLLIPLILGVSAALPGRAQQGLPDRFAFADTTLLRDTLGLRFDRLFVLADSLRMLPDSLRAIAIRTRFGPLRLIELADSLGMPVDSVGPRLEREQFNPLARRVRDLSAFSYTTTYNIQRTRASWTNGSSYDLGWKALFLKNTTSVQMDRFQSGSSTTQRQTRSAATEIGWKLSPDYSLGGRAVLNRFDSNDPSSISRVGETVDEFQVSLHTQQRKRHGLSSEFNLFSGLLDLRNSRQEKRGLTGDLNGRIHHASGGWLVHEITGQMTGQATRTLVPRTGLTRATRDVLGNLSGTLNLFEAAPVGLNSTYSYRRSRVGTPDDAGVIRQVRTTSADANAALRTALGTRGMANLGGTFSLSDQVTALNGPSSRRGNGTAADGRYEWRGATFEGRFQLDFTRSEVPQASQTGGYGEDVSTRSLEGTITRRLLGKLITRTNARIGLTRYRYQVIGNYGTPPVSRDQVQQSYRIDGTYELSRTFNSGVSLEVSRNQLVNLPSASTSANNTQRVYRAEWRWTYRLMRGLTATQRNVLGANYTAYDFVPLSDRAAFEYGTTTTLNTVLTPRLTIDLTHSRLVQPSGNYTLHTDGLHYYRPADESRSSSLTSRVSYTPVSGVSLQLEPFYRASSRDGISGGILVPQRDNRTLNFQGSASLSIRVGSKGLLSGNIGRTAFAERAVTFSSGVPQPSPRTASDFWNGTLNFSWRP